MENVYQYRHKKNNKDVLKSSTITVIIRMIMNLCNIIIATGIKIKRKSKKRTELIPTFFIVKFERLFPKSKTLPQ